MLPDNSAASASARIDTSDAQIYDRGYRHYDGAREGRTHAIRALIVYSIKRGLGIKKRWTAKIIPILVYGFAFFPVVIIVGIRSFIGDAAQGFGYQTLYDLLATVLLVFAAATAPEMLCDDRRQRVLPLYFSRAHQPRRLSAGQAWRARNTHGNDLAPSGVDTLSWRYLSGGQPCSLFC